MYVKLFLSFQADKAVAEEKLSAAKPALEEAEAALQVSLDEFYSYFHNYGARNRPCQSDRNCCLLSCFRSCPYDILTSSVIY